ncbi:MAG: IS3 family transposase [Verrucomicrobiales bacterium]
MRDDYSVTELCDAFDLSRSGYYKSRSREISERDRENGELIEEMKTIHNESYCRAYGSPRMTTELHNRGFACSENRVARLMSRAGIQALYKTAFRPKTNPTGSRSIACTEST